jgi:hypothetical protein
LRVQTECAVQPRVHKHSESLSSSSHRTVLFFRCHFATTLSSPSTSFHTLPIISHLPIPLLLEVPLVDWRIDHPFLYHLHRYCYFNFYQQQPSNCFINFFPRCRLPTTSPFPSTSPPIPIPSLVLVVAVQVDCDVDFSVEAATNCFENK